MYNETSNYPDSIDDLIFYQDADINKLEAIKKYGECIANGDYEGAYAIRDANNLHGLSAELINMLINRTKNLQEYLLTKGKIENIYFETDRPDSVSHVTIWISKRDNG